MDIFQSRVFKIIMSVMGAAALSLNAASPGNSQEVRSPSSESMISTSICELVAHPRRFNNKMISVRADFESDGIERWSLVDPSCHLGVKPAGGVSDPAVAPALLDALHHGCAGTVDKQITATWQGVYHWESRDELRAGMVQRWLDVQKVENLMVVPRQTGVLCPSRR